MKYLVVSDIHGNVHYANILENIINIEKPNNIIILGDLYYHGPSNYSPFYDYQSVVDILNKYKDIIYCTRGNCDNDEDVKNSKFQLEDYIIMFINGMKFYFTHGNYNNIEYPPDTYYDVLVYGHLHTGFIINKDNKLYANPGSLSIPRGGTVNSYLIIDDNNLILKDLEGNVIKKVKYIV